MKKIWLFILWILTLISSFSSASAIDPMNLPKFEHFVNDYSNVFTEKQRLELGMLAKNIETNSGYQIVTVLFPHREGNELFDIALKAFNENKIWNKERNDGLLLAIATEEKKIRIMVWYGLEWKIPDALASKIIEEIIRPEVRKGNFYEAVEKFYEKLPEYLDEPENLNRENSTEEQGIFNRSEGSNQLTPEKYHDLENIGQRVRTIWIYFFFLGGRIPIIINSFISKEKRKELKRKYENTKVMKACNKIGFRWFAINMIWFCLVLISAVLLGELGRLLRILSTFLWGGIFFSIWFLITLANIFPRKMKKWSGGFWWRSDRSRSDSGGSSSSSSDSFSWGGGSSWGWGAGD